MCPMQSVPALVDNWNGTHSNWNTLVNCFARVLATKRRTEEPVAVPLTPPSGFVSAVSLAPMIAGTTSDGTLDCAKLVQAASSNRTLKCSYVHPPGPGEDRGTLQTGQKHGSVQVHRDLRLKIQHLLGQWPDDLFRAPVLQSTESVLIPRNQSGSCETLSRPRHLSKTNLLACLMRPAPLEFGCWDTGRSVSVARLASSNNVNHRPSENLSNRQDNSSFPTLPAPLNFRNNMNGNKRNNFHARSDIVWSSWHSALWRASNATLAAWWNLPFRCAGHPWRTWNLLWNSSSRLTLSNTSHGVHDGNGSPGSLMEHIGCSPWGMSGSRCMTMWTYRDSRAVPRTSGNDQIEDPLLHASAEMTSPSWPWETAGGSIPRAPLRDSMPQLRMALWRTSQPMVATSRPDTYSPQKFMEGNCSALETNHSNMAHWRLPSAADHICGTFNADHCWQCNLRGMSISKLMGPTLHHSADELLNRCNLSPSCWIVYPGESLFMAVCCSPAQLARIVHHDCQWHELVSLEDFLKSERVDRGRV